MNILKKIFSAVLALVFGLALLVGAAYYMMYDSYTDFQTDVDSARQYVWLDLFNRGYITEVGPTGARYIYQKRCYRQCHGDAAMITAILSPAGWFQVVERMRVQEGVEISGPEVDIIIKYLEETYPTTQSKYSYEVRKATHKAVWRNDVGINDIYTDIVYATPEYLESIGAERLIDEYELDKFHVFIISLNVHEGEMEVFDMDAITYLRTPQGDIATTPPWSLRFQTADKHHYESTVRFKKSGVPNIRVDRPGKMELVLKNVGGPEERLFVWSLPIAYPKEIEGVKY